MNQNMTEQIQSLLLKNKKRKRQLLTLMIAAVVVVAATGISMSLPATTATPEVICGLEEHQHTESCYTEETALICGQAESEEHTHTSECYQTTSILTCQTPEHVHEESCYEQGGTISAQSTDLMTAEITYTAGVIHNGTTLTAANLDPADVTLQNPLQQIEQDLNNTKQTISVYQAYDLSLYRDGAEVQPDDGIVTVRLVMQQPITSEKANGTWRLYHIDDYGNLQNLTDADTTGINSNGGQAVTEISFQTNSFSSFLIVGAEDIVEEEPAQEEVREEAETKTKETAEEAEKEKKEEASEAEKSSDESKETKKEDSAKETKETKETKEETKSEEKSETKTETAEAAYPAQQFTGTADSVTVSVSADEGALPTGASMKVKAVEDDSIISAAKDAAEQTKEVKAKAVDISFYDESGKEIEPRQPIRVTMKTDAIRKTNDVTVVHVDDDSNAEVIQQTSSQLLSEEEQPGANEVVFDSQQFSAYVLIYTVDFSYGEYTYSIQGESSILLSELLEALHIYNEDQKLLTADDISGVEFSDESLVEITTVDGDWKLTSLQAFQTEESLTLYLTNGDTLVIDVTDSQTVTELNDSVSGITVKGATKTDSGYQVNAGDSYEVTVNFKETDNIQFNTTAGETLTYQLPTGFVISEAQSGTGEITNNGGTVTYTYTIDTSGKVTITWPNLTEDDPAWKELIQSQYLEMYIKVAGTFNSNADEVIFSAGADGTVVVENQHSLSVDKTGTYNPTTNQIDYTVTVKSSGHNTNINITDTVTGAALTYQSDSFKSSNSAGSVTHNSNGFTYHLDSMSNGETVTITYSADVNLDEITWNEDGTYNGTVSQTGNTVKVTGDDTPDDSKTVDGKDFSNKISYSNISKSAAGTADTDEETVKTVTWNIKANTNANVSMAGKTITDTIDASSTDIMKYSGSGITILVRDKSGNLVETRNVSWSDLNVNTSTATGWTYTVPSTDKNYSYEITYTTDVQASQTDSTTVKNGATDGNGDSSSGNITIEPTAGDTTISKEAVNVDTSKDTITWKITLEVPYTGYSSYSVKDFYPNEWVQTSSQYVYFSLFDDITVTGLEGTETYTTDSSNPEYLLVTFYKDGNGTTGLNKTSEPRTITITLTTKMSDLFAERAKENPETKYWPKNNATVYAENKELSVEAQALVQYSDATLTKTNQDKLYNNYVNGSSSDPLPAIRYDVTVTGLTESSFDEDGNFILTDNYDGTYLTWTTIRENWGIGETEKKWNGVVYGQLNNHGEVYRTAEMKKVIENTSEGVLTITLKKDELPMTENGEFYDSYTIPYYLTVKSEEALKELINTAAKNYNGIYTLSNTVKNGEYGSAQSDYDYTTDLLTKTASDAVYDTNTGNYVVDYKLVLNPQAQMLGDSNSLELVDTSSNLTIDLSSIQASPSLGVSWNTDSSNRLVFTIPNATKVTITYRAKVVGSGTVNYSNTAALYGQEKTSSGTCDTSSSSGGTSKTYKMNVLKYEEGDVMTVLEGVEFDLYVLSENDGRDSQPAADDSRWIKINDADNPFVTGEDGMININADALKAHDSNNYHGGNALYHSRWYKLVEHSAPTVNGITYQLDTAAHMFWIDSTADVDYSNSVYANDDTITISNTPVDATKLGFTIKKTWEGADASDLPDSVTIHLYQKDSIYASNNTAVEVKSITLKKSDFEGLTEWTGEFSDLDKGKAYFIVEDAIKGYVAEYEDENTIGYTRSGTINLSNVAETEFEVSKAWKKADGTTDLTDESMLPDSITVALYMDEEKYDDYTITKQNGWKLTITGLPGNHTYTVVEEVPEDFEQVSVEYAEDGKSAVITNKSVSDTPPSNVTQVSVAKKWLDTDGTEITDSSKLADLTATMQLTRYQKAVDGTVLHFWYWDGSAYVKMADEVVRQTNSVSVQFTRINREWTGDLFYSAASPENYGQWEKNDTDPKAEKQSDDTMSTVTYSFSTADVTELNLRLPQQGTMLTDLTVTNGSLVNDSSDLAGYALDESYSRTLSLSVSNSWNGTFSNLPTYKVSADGTLYAYVYVLKEIESSEGYSFVSYANGDSVSATSQEDGILAADGSKTIIVTNQQQDTTTDFWFTKIWKDTEDNKITWEDNQSISVTLNGVFTPDNGQSSTVMWEYTITNENSELQVKKKDESAPDMTVQQNAASEYVFTIANLPAEGTYNNVHGTWSYTLTENSVEGYETQYYSTDEKGSIINGGSTHEEKTNISSGEAIVNKQIAYYELPTTGGSGTFKFIFSGLSLMIISLLLLFRRKPKERRAMKG